MNKKEVLVEYLCTINSVIKQSLHHTQRIRFTCFDLSLNYIVFGATSGGIYILNRQPCKFIKLIPNKEGSVTNIVVSPDQKDVAVSTSKGFIVVVENCFCDSNLQYQIYTQHEGNIITAMKWYSNDLYSGDNIGQISVISLTPLLTKALFQTPSATLMQLDSSIVQLDIYSNFLLVSTKTRTYLCDTLQEQYRQIGKKLRDGNFGACFYYKTNSYVCISQGSDEKTSRGIKTNNIPLVNIEDVKIYCARPGSRLWEANFDSSVVCTHQFRDSLTINAAPIIHLQENEHSHLNVSNIDENISLNFNFEKIFVFTDYILTFRTDGIYIFDVKTVALLYWTNYFSDIKDIKILDNMIYIWLDNNSLKILSLLDIESFVTNVLSRKQYLLCAQFCLLWMDDLSVLISDNKLQVLKVLHEKLTDKKLAKDIEPLMTKFERNKIYSQKLRNGIYVVDNVHHRENCQITKNKVILKSPVDNDNKVNIPQIQEFSASKPLNAENKRSEEIDPHSDKNYLINILNKQYQINRINNSVTVPKFQELMQNKSLEELKTIFDLFLEYSEDGNESRQWITTQILKFVNLNTTEDLKKLDYNSKLFHFISECFIHLNKSNDCCKCSFPLSSASLKTIHFYEIGGEIIGKYDNFSSLCKEVPSMYRFPLENCQQNLITLLPLLIQYNDSSLFNKYCTKFTYDMWDEAIKYFVKLKRNICLNCDTRIKNSLNTTWNDFAKCVLNSIGGPSTLKLLSRYSKYIPTGELDTDFYQACIFVSCLPNNENDNKTKYSKFLEDIQKHELCKTEFDLLILKYLKNKDVGEDKRNNFMNLVDSNCPVCDISLKSLLFEDTVKLKCGHFSHKICSINTEICPSCSTRI